MFLIVGTGRCGSTLLQSMISRNEQIAIAFETKYLLDMDPAKLNMNDPIRPQEIEKYIDLVRQRTRRHELSRDPALMDRYCDAVRSGMLDARSQFRWAIGAGIGDQCGRIWGEKTPGHWEKLGRALEIEPDCKIIHLVRDPRGVTEALMRMDWWHLDSVYQTAKYCARAMRSCKNWESILGHNQHLTVRYEDLIVQPRVELVRVSRFLGVKFDEAMLGNDAGAAASANAFDTRNERWDGTDAQSLNAAKLTQFRKKLSTDQIRLIESVVGARLMSEFGYTPDSTSIQRFAASFSRAGHAVVSFQQRQFKSLCKRVPHRANAR